MARENHVRVTTFSLDDLKREIALLHGVSMGTADASGRFGKLHARIDWQHDHFYKRKIANPTLNPPYDKMAVYQSDKPRQVHRALKARLTQQHYQFHAQPPRMTAALQDAADRVEKLFTFGFQNLEIRTGMSLQDPISDGLIIDGFRLVHWRMAEDVFPPVPDYEWMEEMPEEAAPDRQSVYMTDDGMMRHSRFRHEGTDYEEYDGEDGKGRYRESDASWQRRYGESKAKAGFPWFVEMIGPMDWSIEEDRSLANGLAKVLVVRRVSVPVYKGNVERGDLRLSLNEQNRLIPIYGSADAPPQWLATATQGWPDTCYVASFWTRNEYYELVSKSGSDWELVKSDTHPYGMPPFVLIKAIETTSPLPEERWWPALQGVYDTKPAYDRIRALIDAISEMIALPYKYIEQADGSPLIDPGSGKILTLSRNAELSEIWPAGAKLVEVKYELAGEMLLLLQRSLQDMEDATPGTGQADISGTTKPWTARQSIQQADVEPAALIANTAKGIQIMARNMAEVMSSGAFGQGETLYIFGQVKNGKKVEQTLIGVEPDEIKSIQIDVTIDAVSQAERSARTQEYMELFQAGHITRREFDEEGRGIEDASEHEKELEAEVLWRQAQPTVRQQLLRAYFGNRYVLGQGEIIGPDGQPFEPTGPPPREVTQRAAGAQALEGIVAEPRMPRLPPLSVTGTEPLGGLPG